MFFKEIKQSIPLDRPVEIQGDKLLPKLSLKLNEITSLVDELDSEINELPEKSREGTNASTLRRELLRQQTDLVVQKEWLTQLTQIVDKDRVYLLSIGEAKILGIIKKEG